MDQYVSVLHEIVTRGLTTNSYKFALWRALARLAPTTDKSSPKIFKRDLSLLFLEYYWPLEVKYHIRQDIDPDKDPIVMRLIRQSVYAGMIMEGETLTDFRRRMPDKHNTLLAGIEREAFDDVIPRFHTVHRAPIAPAVFTFTGRIGKAGDQIEVTHGGRQFLSTKSLLITSPFQAGCVSPSDSLRPRVARQDRWRKFRKGCGFALAQAARGNAKWEMFLPREPRHEFARS